MSDEPKGHHLFSPTQISTYIECPRKWAWRRIAKIYDPPNASAALGTETHALLEKYLTDGTMPDHVAHPTAAKVASAGLHLLPAPGTKGMLLERSFRFQSPRTHYVYNGLKDVEIEPGVPVVTLGADGSAPIVIDHKTTSSIDSYAKSADDLLYDPQAIIYAIDSMARFESRLVDLRWVYYQTKGPSKSYVTSQRIDSSHAAKVFEVIEQVASEAASALDRGIEPLDLEPNPSACSAYGGCPHRHRCNLKPSEQARSHMSNSLIASLRARVQSTVPAAVVTEAPKADAIIVSPPEVQEAPQELPSWATSEVDPLKASKINPPESEEAPAVVPVAVAEAPVEKPKRRRRVEAKDPVAADVHASEGQDVATASGVIEHVTVVANITAEEAGALKEELEATRSAVCGGSFTLYVDCLPIGKAAKLVSSFFEKANQDVDGVYGVPDYRLVDYGKGTPLFASSVIEQALAYGGDVVVDTRTPEGSVVVEGLASKAKLVVRGFR